MLCSHFKTLFLYLIAGIFLASCGGGGGGGSGAVSSELSLERTLVSFAAIKGGEIPLMESVTFTSNDSKGVSVSTNQPATWLDVVVEGSALKLNITTTNLSKGTYTTTVRVDLKDENGSIIAFNDLAVTYIVDTDIVANPNLLEFSVVEGGPAPSLQSVSIQSSGDSWTASSDQGWVTLSATTGMAPSSIDVGVNNTGLAPGNYSATITVQDVTSGYTTTIAATLTVTPALFTLSSTSLNISAVNGAVIEPLTIDVGLNNGQAISWSATPSDWLMASGTGTTPGTLIVSVDPSKEPSSSGTHVATISLNGYYNTTPVAATVCVNLTLSPPGFVLSSSNLSFTGTSGVPISTQDITVSSNNGQAIAWSTWTDDAWITLSPTSGTTPGTLTIGVDPTIGPLASGTHYGLVYISGVYNGNVLTWSVGVKLTLN